MKNSSQPKIINYKSRLLFEVMMGFLFHLIVVKTFFKGYPLRWEGIVFSICIFVIISEGIFTFNKILGMKYTWHQHTFSRLIYLLLFTAVWYISVVLFSFRFKPLLEHEVVISKTLFLASMIMSILFLTIYVVVLIIYNYHQTLSAFKVENEQLKSEKLRLDYRALQDQINPHFLFNNLSTLIAMIRQDQKAAIRFAENFSDVYRYVLQSKDYIAVPLKDELNFVKSYLQLHKERLGGGLHIRIDVADEVMEKQLPVLSLQFLVENAIKHNVATLACPLTIDIQSDQDVVRVKNNLNPKNSTYSTNTGLENLEKRIAFLTDRQMNINHDEKEFVVELPLIE